MSLESILNISYQNYDQIFKISASIFEDKVIDFLGVDLPKIESFVETEFAEIETKNEMLDFNFRLEDGSILHLEEETDISKSDLIRFASYDLKLYNRYYDRIRTVILCINGFEDSKANFNTGSLDYRTTVVDMSDMDGDSKLEEIRQKVETGEEINVLELIFLPLMDSERRIVDMVKEAIDCEQKLNFDKPKMSKVIAMTLAVVDKFLADQEIEEIWGEYKMLKIFKYAEEKGEEKGIEIGKEEEREKAEKEKREMVKKMLEKDIEIEEVAEISGLSKEEIEELQKGMKH